MLDISGVKQQQKGRKVYSKRGHQGKSKGHNTERTWIKAALKTLKSEAIAWSNKRALYLIWQNNQPIQGKSRPLPGVLHFQSQCMISFDGKGFLNLFFVPSIL